MLSGGVDEDLYNNLYENETLLNNNNSFFESPVLIAIEGSGAAVCNKIVEIYNNTAGYTDITADATYFGNCYLYSRYSYLQVGIATNKSGDTDFINRLISIIENSDNFDGHYIFSDCEYVKSDYIIKCTKG